MGVSNADVQQGVTGDLVTAFGLGPDAVHTLYAEMGGMCSPRSIERYLLGTGGLPQLQRDLVSHAVNELVGDARPGTPETRAPYSDSSVAAAAGYAHSSSDGDVVAESRRSRPRGHAREVHDDEAQRLASLEASDLLTTVPPASLDRLPRLAREYFGSMAAAITLITEDRQVTHAIDGRAAEDVPRDVSFCSETVRYDRTLIVSDTLRDRRFSTNPYVTGEPRIRFYAGHPILGPGGHRIGALCIVDDKPRRFTPEDETKLRTLAALVQLEIWNPRHAG